MSVLKRMDEIQLSLQDIHEKLDRLLAKPFKLIKKMEEPKKNLTMKIDETGETIVVEKENPDMDLTEVVLLKETPLAFLAYKKRMQVWVAKSHLDGEYKVGNTYDLKVKEKSKWILDKLDWKPFTVVKG